MLATMLKVEVYIQYVGVVAIAAAAITYIASKTHAETWFNTVANLMIIITVAALAFGLGLLVQETCRVAW